MPDHSLGLHILCFLIETWLFKTLVQISTPTNEFESHLLPILKTVHFLTHKLCHSNSYGVLTGGVTGHLVSYLLGIHLSIVYSYPLPVSGTYLLCRNLLYSWLVQSFASPECVCLFWCLCNWNLTLKMRTLQMGITPRRWKFVGLSLLWNFLIMYLRSLC
jgi:hypothetical protein